MWKGKTNAIYILPAVIERALEEHKERFDTRVNRVRYDEIIPQLIYLKRDGKDLQVIKKHILGTDSINVS